MEFMNIKRTLLC